MKKIVLLLLTTSFFFSSAFMDTAIAIGGDGEACCNAGYRPIPARRSCVNEQVFTTCANFGSSACGAATTVCNTLGCTVPANCATSIATWCSDRASVGGAAAIDVVTVCATIASTMGIGASAFAAACVAALFAPVATLQAILNSFNVTDPTTCIAGLVCNWTAAAPACSASAAGPTIPPYDPTCAGGAGIKSALGCLPVNATTFVNTAMPWTIGLGSGIAFLLGLYGAFLIVTASGDPEKAQAGKELITSVVLGVVVIIFAITILAVTGETILKLF